MAPVIAAGDTDATAGARDERDFHLPTTLKLAGELPRPDLEGLNTATTPGNHLVLAVAVEAGVNDRALLQSIAALFSLAMVLAAFGLIRRYADPWLAFALTLPLLLSHYVLQSAAWINTDNAAVLFVLLALGAALAIEATGRGYAWAGLWVFLGVWVRQLALWVAGPIVAAAALAGGRRPVRPLVAAGLALLPAVVSLAILFVVWGQLTPPAVYQEGASPTAIPFMLALIGVFGPFFAWPALRPGELRGRLPVAAAGAAAVLALAIPTAEATEREGRTGGGLWKVVERAPELADRSLAIAVLAPVGGLVLVALWRAAERQAARRPALVVLFGLLCLTVAQAATFRTYQRYFEPTLIVLLALLLALGPRPRSRALLAMGALSLLQLAGCVWVVYSEL